MLPLTLLNAAQCKPMLVELKNGETFNGHLIACDNFMNLTLREVYQTSADGERFWKLPECYIRGSTIKYCRIADSVIDTVKEQEEAARKQRQAQGYGHGHGRGGQGRGSGPGRGGPGGRGGGPPGRGVSGAGRAPRGRGRA
ncbi:Sm-like ribonucleo protein [Tilletiaria anomala UBC 951]|uniref:LSM complex subunit LSM4 n=1 Tax=Tilletiaria anomala (strain ATCC 24038 / CBS 436.72 / UBC 951) TaxID=1037660 RepID=A0A066WBL8_TILAU|nr:Sm-like ribonucleoprotein [Tilletiaria anomala UBC 951]KDN49918.1 Sm-like ribonucleo protein [Tilletiaria anomala UBC 951]